MNKSSKIKRKSKNSIFAATAGFVGIVLVILEIYLVEPESYVCHFYSPLMHWGLVGFGVFVGVICDIKQVERVGSVLFSILIIIFLFQWGLQQQCF